MRDGVEWHEAHHARSGGQFLGRNRDPQILRFDADSIHQQIFRRQMLGPQAFARGFQEPVAPRATGHRVFKVVIENRPGRSQR